MCNSRSCLCYNVLRNRKLIGFICSRVLLCCLFTKYVLHKEDSVLVQNFAPRGIDVLVFTFCGSIILCVFQLWEECLNYYWACWVYIRIGLSSSLFESLGCMEDSWLCHVYARCSWVCSSKVLISTYLLGTKIWCSRLYGYVLLTFHSVSNLYQHTHTHMCTRARAHTHTHMYNFVCFLLLQTKNALILI